jgi:POT family proton-dependent oligopeptide transporter
MKYGDMHYSTDHLLKIKPWFLRSPFIILYCLIAIGFISCLLHSSMLGKWLLPSIGIILLVFMFTLAFREDAVNRPRLLTLNILIMSSVVFWMMFWQIFFSANLFIDRLIDKHIFGINVPTTWFYTLESIFIILLGPLFAWSWQTLNRNEKNPTPFSKFILAIFFVGLGFLTLTISTYFPNENNLVNPLWIVLSYFLITVGELLLSPIGLSAVTMLSPPRLTGMMMGIWFAALGFGGQFGGLLAKISSIPESAKESITQLPIYRSAFFIYASIAFGVAIILFLLQWIVKKR